MRVVIIGGSHGGIACALRAREEYPASEVVLYEKQGTIGFVAQSIPLYLMGAPDFLRLRSYTNIETLESKGIVVRTETAVQGVDTAAKRIQVVPRRGNQGETDRYDKLVLATGSHPSVPLAVDESRELLVVKNYDDAVRIQDLMRTATSVMVIGGGAVWRSHGSWSSTASGPSCSRRPTVCSTATWTTTSLARCASAWRTKAWRCTRRCWR